MFELLLSTASTASAQPVNARLFDPRHFYDKRCAGTITMDGTSEQRDPASVSSYLSTALKAGATAQAEKRKRTSAVERGKPRQRRGVAGMIIGAGDVVVVI